MKKPEVQMDVIYRPTFSERVQITAKREEFYPAKIDHVNSGLNADDPKAVEQTYEDSLVNLTVFLPDNTTIQVIQKSQGEKEGQWSFIE